MIKPVLRSLSSWLVFVVAVLSASGCVLPPWPVGEPGPTYENAGDNSSDDDDVLSNNDEGSAGDDDDAVSDDDDSFNPDDHDEDGWEDAEDCNDSNPEVHPGAEELHCDGIDNNCDGSRDCIPCEAELTLDISLTPGEYGYSGSIDEDSLVDETLKGGPYYFDIYRVETLATGFLDLTYMTNDFRPHLEIRDSDCSILSTDSPLLSDTAWLFTGTQPNDYFYVMAATYHPAQAGSYSLDMSVTGF